MSFTGERLPLSGVLLNPMRIENFARYKFTEKFITGKKILDMGCGFGEGLGYLNKKNPNLEIIGIDKSFTAIDGAKSSFSSITFCINDIERTSFVSNYFDFIISFETIEHLNSPINFVLEAYRLLKPNGTFILTTPNKLISSPTKNSLWPDHIQEFTPKDLNEILRTSFNDVTVIGEKIPIFEKNTFRQFVHKLAPIIKPILPKFFRINALPLLQTIIKRELAIDDVYFSQENEFIDEFPTLVAICKKND